MHRQCLGQARGVRPVPTVLKPSRLAPFAESGQTGRRLSGRVAPLALRYRGWAAFRAILRMRPEGIRLGAPRQRRAPRDRVGAPRSRHHRHNPGHQLTHAAPHARRGRERHGRRLVLAGWGTDAVNCPGRVAGAIFVFPYFAGRSGARPAGFEPATGGLEVRDGLLSPSIAWCQKVLYLPVSPVAESVVTYRRVPLYIGPVVVEIVVNLPVHQVSEFMKWSRRDSNARPSRAKVKITQERLFLTKGILIRQVLASIVLVGVTVGVRTVPYRRCCRCG